MAPSVKTCFDVGFVHPMADGPMVLFRVEKKHHQPLLEGLHHPRRSCSAEMDPKQDTELRGRTTAPPGTPGMGHSGRGAVHLNAKNRERTLTGQGWDSWYLRFNGLNLRKPNCFAQDVSLKTRSTIYILVFKGQGSDANHLKE